MVHTYEYELGDIEDLLKSFGLVPVSIKLSSTTIARLALRTETHAW